MDAHADRLIEDADALWHWQRACERAATTRARMQQCDDPWLRQLLAEEAVVHDVAAALHSELLPLRAEDLRAPGL